MLFDNPARPAVLLPRRARIEDIQESEGTIIKSPWKWSTFLERGREYLVLASSIPPKSRRSTRRLFRGAHAGRKQLAALDHRGVVEVSRVVVVG